MSKLPFKISSEELLASLEEASEAPLEEVAFDSDVPIFLSKFKIETGENQVLPRLLYKLYRLFSQEPVNQKTFSCKASVFIRREKVYFRLNITTQQILKILNPQKNRNIGSSLLTKKHYDKFILENKIEKGTRWTEGFLLYEVYRFYCIDNKISRTLLYEVFIQICKLHFEYKRIGKSKGVQFKLNDGVLDILTDEHIQRIRNARLKDEKFKEARRKKETKPIKRKIPGFRP